MSTGPLAASTTAFIDVTAEALAALSGKSVDHHRQDAVIEVSNLVSGIIASDRRQTVAELEAYLDALGHRLQPPLTVTAAQLRQSAVLDGRDAWLGAASTMFDLLARADAQRGTRAAYAYYDAALAVAHVTAAVDLVPSPDEIAAIDRLRMALLAHFDTVGLPRPGAPVAGSGGSPSSGSPSPGSTAGGSTGPAGHGPGAVAPTATSGTAAAPQVAAAELGPTRPIAELLAELDELIGLASVKAEIRRLTSLLQVQQLRAERNLPTVETSHHLVFTGNPGTGKTTVARLLSQIYRSLGVVATGHLVETDRSKLVAGFVGQTALKTKDALEAALGGTLLIDEAYALARGGDNDFGREAIDTVVKFMEDHRDDIAIVAAGYPTEMADFIDANPGLKSRFTRTVHFPDYTDLELVQIFVKLGEKNRYTCSDDALAAVAAQVAAEPRTRGFGNARFVRNLFETAVSHQAMRLAPLTDPSNEQLTTLTAADIAPVDS